MTTDIQQLYGDFWATLDDAIDARLSVSLLPRSPEMLFDAFASFGIAASDHVLDIGGRDAKHAIELARRFGCQVTLLDPIPLHIDLAEAAIAASDQSDRVTPLLGSVESMTFADGAFDHIWCRDVLCHVDPWRALTESARVLRSGGGMLVYQTFTTDLLEPLERDWLFEALALDPAAMIPANFAAAAAAAGLHVVASQHLGSEWRERWLEDGDARISDELLRLSRLRRQWPRMVDEFGLEAANATLAGASWGLYQFLGKTEPTLYLLRKDPQ